MQGDRPRPDGADGARVQEMAMFTTLAQAVDPTRSPTHGSAQAGEQAVAAADAVTQAGPGNVFEVVTAIFSRLDTLAHPDNLLPALQQLSMVWAVAFLCVGVACLLNGYKYYRTVTVATGAILGVCAGYYLGKQIQAEYIVAGCLGLLMTVACLPLMRYAVALFGGLAGAFIGANLWASVAQLVGGPAASVGAGHYWVGALLGLAVLGLLAFVVFKHSVVMFTAISGSTIAVLGGVALLLQVPMWRDAVSASVSAHAVVVPLLVVVPAVIGLILQEVPLKPAADAKPKA